MVHLVDSFGEVQCNCVLLIATFYLLGHFVDKANKLGGT